MRLSSSYERIAKRGIDAAPSLRLDGQTYGEAYLNLSAQLEDSLSHFSGFAWNEAARDYFRAVAGSMRAWVAACRQFAVV